MKQEKKLSEIAHKIAPLAEDDQGRLSGGFASFIPGFETATRAGSNTNNAVGCSCSNTNNSAGCSCDGTNTNNAVGCSCSNSML